jgi:hypothetical protein
MKRLMLAAAMAAAVMTAGCTGEELSSKVTAVQAGVVQSCKFVVDYKVVIALLTASEPTVATVGGAITAICAAITRPMSLLTRGEPVPTVGDVVIEGVFLPDEVQMPPLPTPTPR